jgi:transposase InsO family protein
MDCGMEWKKMLSYVSRSGTALCIEYLLAENRILRNQIQGGLRLTDSERKSLAEIGARLGRKALAQVATMVKPETILAWHRRLVAKKFDGSKQRGRAGRPATDPELEQLILRLAKDNCDWGYDRIQGAVQNLGYTVSDQTVGNILRRHGIVPAPERRKETTWKEFIRTHLEVLAATDFFTAEVWTCAGLITFDVLIFIRLESRQVYLAGITPHPTDAWMRQTARNVTMADVGFLNGCRYLLHDRDTKFSRGFDQILSAAGAEPVRLPARSPNLNAICERWIRSVKGECLSKLNLFGEGSLRHSLERYILHHQQERDHQGKDNVVLFPLAEDRIGQSDGPIALREGLGGMVKSYYRQAA